MDRFIFFNIYILETYLFLKINFIIMHGNVKIFALIKKYIYSNHIYFYFYIFRNHGYLFITSNKFTLSLDNLGLIS